MPCSFDPLISYSSGIIYHRLLKMLCLHDFSNHLWKAANLTLNFPILKMHLHNIFAELLLYFLKNNLYIIHALFWILQDSIFF